MDKQRQIAGNIIRDINLMAGYVKQVGAIPLIVEKGDIKTVLVTAKNQSDIWIFPKGHCERGVSGNKMSQLEAYEEAGVTGKVKHKKCGSFKYSKMNRDYKVKYYPMLVEDVLQRWPESRQRKRAVVSVSKALKMLRQEKMKKLLKRSVIRINKSLK